MRNIETQLFYSATLQKEIGKYNEQAANLTTERADIEAQLATLKTEALSGSVDNLATLSKRRDGLKSRLLNNLIESVRLLETRASFKEPIAAAYASEKAKREATLATRTEEIEAVFQRHGLATKFLQGVVNETVMGLRQGARDVVTPPQIETDLDKEEVVTLRRSISSMMG